MVKISRSFGYQKVLHTKSTFCILYTLQTQYCTALLYVPTHFIKRERKLKKENKYRIYSVILQHISCTVYIYLYTTPPCT